MRKTNHVTIIQSILLILTVVLIAYGLISGKINKYVHPRFNIGLWLSIIVLLIFIISMLMDKKKGRHNISYQHYLVYLMPLIFAIAFQPVASGNTDVVLADSITSSDNKSITSSDYNGSDSDNAAEQSYDQTDSSQTDTGYSDSANGQDSSGKTEYSNVEEYLQDTQDQQDVLNQQDAQVTPEEQKDSKVTDTSDVYQTNEIKGYYVIDDDIFADWFMDLYDHTDDFAGEKYQFLAQVFSMEDLKENQFLAGRNFMVCCAADLVGYGLICDSDIRSELQENQWIVVKATISKCEYEGTEVPLLIDAEIENAEAPKVEYIYYNSY